MYNHEHLKKKLRVLGWPQFPLNKPNRVLKFKKNISIQSTNNFKKDKLRHG